MKNIGNLISKHIFNIMLVASVAMLSFSVAPSYAGSKSKSDQSSHAVKNHVVKAININKADAETIAQSLKGIGLKKAEAVVAWRKKHGKFKTIEQLAEVKGIGMKTIEKNRKQIKL